MVAHKPYNVNRFIEKSNPKVFPCRGGVPDAPPRYYYHPTTDGIFSAPNSISCQIFLFLFPVTEKMCKISINRLDKRCSRAII